MYKTRRVDPQVLSWLRVLELAWLVVRIFTRTSLSFLQTWSGSFYWVSFVILRNFWKYFRNIGWNGIFENSKFHFVSISWKSIQVWCSAALLLLSEMSAPTFSRQERSTSTISRSGPKPDPRITSHSPAPSTSRVTFTFPRLVATSTFDWTGLNSELTMESLTHCTNRFELFLEKIQWFYMSVIRKSQNLIIILCLFTATLPSTPWSHTTSWSLCPSLSLFKCPMERWDFAY